VQADLETFHQHAVYGAAAITLLTASNTRGVYRVEVMEPALVREQITAVLDDVRVHAAKTGALGSEAWCARWRRSPRASTSRSTEGGDGPTHLAWTQRDGSSSGDGCCSAFWWA
jgi:hypothetical protein